MTRKRVYVSEEVWERLMALKLERKARSVDEILKQLLNLQLAPPSPPPSPSPPGGESARSLEATEDAVQPVRPPPPPPPPRPVPSRVDWGFCPQCLSVFAYEGHAKCPKCGVDLVSMRTGEGKELYRKLKAEKRERGEL